MKKTLILLFMLFISGCAQPANNIVVQEPKAEKQITSSIGQKLTIEKPIENKILQSEIYALECNTKYFTNTTIGGEIINESYIKTSEGHEHEILYVDNEEAKFFGADFQVVQDDEFYLIVTRHYPISGLTEIVSINKKTGIGFDIKTLTMGISGGPNSDTYILSCAEV